MGKRAGPKKAAKKKAKRKGATDSGDAKAPRSVAVDPVLTSAEASASESAEAEGPADGFAAQPVGPAGPLAFGAAEPVTQGLRDSVPRLAVSADGFLDDDPVSQQASWGKFYAPKEDTRSLAELIESVTAALPPKPGPETPAEPVATEATSPPHDPGGDQPSQEVLEAEDGPDEGTLARHGRRRLLLGLASLLVMLALGFGALQLAGPMSGEDPSGVSAASDQAPADAVSGSGDSGGSAGDSGEAEPGAADAAAGGAANGTPSPGDGDSIRTADEGSGATSAAPTPTPQPASAQQPAPTDKPTAAPTPTPKPATAGPTPTPKPTAAPAPIVTPPPTPPPNVHVGDLTGESQTIGANARITVAVYAHDANHAPVAGATVTGAWSGANGDTSCVTGANGSCKLETKPVSRPGSVTFSVTDISHGTLAYDPTQNHKTSITVTF